MSTPKTVAPKTVAQAAPTVRTTAAARAERAGRRPAPRTSAAALEAATDALIGPYNPQEDYPALSGRNLTRREIRDAARRESALMPSSGGNLDTFGMNVNDSTFNRIVPAHSVQGPVLRAQADAEVERILAALELSPELLEVIRLRLAGNSLAEIAAEFHTTKQTIARRIDGMGKKLALFWYSDQGYGMDSVYLNTACRHIHHSLSDPRTTEPASVCDCGSWSSRMQKVKGKEGEYTYHCENCKKKRTASEFKEMISENVVWGS